MIPRARDCLAFGVDVVRTAARAAARGLSQELAEARPLEAMQAVRQELDELAQATSEGRPVQLERLPG